jgi:hypothetical protein
MSANIKTHYTLKDTTVTESEGGCSVTINNTDNLGPKLKIYVSTNRHLRECALITDFPDQLIEALELKPAELPKLYPLLQVPLASLNALMVKEGFTDGVGSDDLEDSEDSGNQSEGSDDGSSGLVSETPASGSQPDNAGSVFTGSISASARSQTTRTAPRIHLNDSPRSRPATPELQSRHHLNAHPNPSPDRRPTTPRPTVTGLYGMENRSRNRDRIQSFARNFDTTPTSGRNDRSIFDMNALRGALEDTEPTLVTTPLNVHISPTQRAGPDQNRNEEQRARDFEVGFLGEQFVSPPLISVLPRDQRLTFSLRYTPCYTTH